MHLSSSRAALLPHFNSLIARVHNRHHHIQTRIQVPFRNSHSATKSFNLQNNPLTATATATATATTPLSRLQSGTRTLSRLHPETRTLSTLTTITTMSSSSSSNSFVKPPQPPPLFNHTNESILAETKTLCDERRALADKLVVDVKPENATFDNVLLPQIELDHHQTLSSYIITFYKDVSADAEKRHASASAEEIFDKTNIDLGMRRDMYSLTHALYERRDELGIDPESLRYLEKEHRGYIRSGLGLPDGPQRDRFRAILERISELAIKFSTILNEENGGLWLTPAQLDGLPEDVIETLQKGTDENEGKMWLSFKYPDYFPSLKFIKDPMVRKEVMVANENKCNENAPIFKEVIILRDESARLLGYPNHAAVVLETKMAKTVENVTAFLDDLRTRLLPASKEQVGHLKEIKATYLKSHNLPADELFWLWDYLYYDRILIEKEYQIEENKIADYFPLSSTVTGMLGIFEQLLGLRFVELGPSDKAAVSPTGKGEDVTWHEDVIMFAVWDSADMGGEFVGYLYLDMHPRNGKFSHAANFNLQPGFLRRDGTRRYPATALVCNFSKPTAKKPSLLKHDEVTTLFHELGHGIHNLAGRTRYARFHGTSTARDFVEAPSQMLENWCWTPSIVKPLSKHWETGEQIPDDLLASLIRTKNVNGAILNLRQLLFALFDMKMHTPATHEDVKKIEPAFVFNNLRTELSAMAGPEVDGAKPDWSHKEATFGHLISGYDAGYYGYLYSQVYSTDMFWTVFKKDPMDGREGRRYRKVVLERGGSRDEMENLVEFLGRKPNNKAFLEDLGIA